MPKEANVPSAVFQLRAVELIELAINKLNPGFSINNFNFMISVENNIDRDQKVVVASTRVIIHADDNTTELGKVTCACIFNVSNFEEVVKMKSENSFELAEAFAETINSISISTTRGLMASELKGTILHHAFLPIIDIKSLSKIPAG